MPVRLSAFAAQPSSVQTVTLDDIQCRLTLTWKARLRGWYLDLATLSGTTLIQGVRLSPGRAPLLGHALGSAGGPGGQLYVRGRDGYRRTDLGESLYLLYYSEAEVGALAA